MAEVPSSKTTAQLYANKKGVQRVSVSFDASKLPKDNTLSEALLSEFKSAIKAAKARLDA
jgi:hypothetical protein